MLRLLSGILRTLLSRQLNMFVRLCRFLFTMLVFAHFGACAWFAVGDYCLQHHRDCGSYGWLDANGMGDHTSRWKQYSTAWYWSVVTLMTTGYGDITATNMLEQWVSSICILIGTCFFGYVVSAVGTLLADGDRVRSEQNERIEQANHFCASKRLPKDLAHAVITHTKYHCKYNFLFDEMIVLSYLPRHLRYIFVI